LGYTLNLSEQAKDFIVDKGYDEKFGARPLKRALQKYIEDRLAEEIIKSNLQEGDSIQMDVNAASDDLEIVISKSKSKDVSN
jgi:ATP-dependent Clp protease ATP-binding subunit ClpC